MSQAPSATAELQPAPRGYAQSRMIWFKRTGPLTQALFTLPLLGHLTGQQAIIIVGFGIPVLFGVLSATGDVAAAVIPFLVIAVFALIRPPVMSYEARLFTLLRFHAVGGPVKAGAKKKGRGSGGKPASSRSRFMSRPGSGPRKKPSEKDAEAAEVDEEERGAGDDAPREVETMEVGTYPGYPVDMYITLRDRAGHLLTGRRVGVLLDGTMMRTAMSSNDGKIPILIDPDEAIGTRRLAICEVGSDGSPASAIIEKRIAFVPRTRGAR